jgi:hypothetical protein
LVCFGPLTRYQYVTSDTGLSGPNRAVPGTFHAAKEETVGGVLRWAPRRNEAGKPPVSEVAAGPQRARTGARARRSAGPPPKTGITVGVCGDRVRIGEGRTGGCRRGALGVGAGPRVRVNASDLPVVWAAEGQLELTEQGGASVRRRLRAEAVLSEEARDGLFVDGGFEPTHRPAAPRASVQVGQKYVPQKPGPAGGFCGAVVAAGVEERELIALCRRRAMLGRVLFRFGDDFGPKRGMARTPPTFSRLEQSDPI